MCIIAVCLFFFSKQTSAYAFSAFLLVSEMCISVRLLFVFVFVYVCVSVCGCVCVCVCVCVSVCVGVGVCVCVLSLIDIGGWRRAKMGRSRWARYHDKRKQ